MKKHATKFFAHTEMYSFSNQYHNILTLPNGCNCIYCINLLNLALMYFCHFWTSGSFYRENISKRKLLNRISLNSMGFEQKQEADSWTHAKVPLKHIESYANFRNSPKLVQTESRYTSTSTGKNQHLRLLK